jgi:hypothetical protein
LEFDDRAMAESDLKQAIATYAARLPNWDGIGGIAPSPDAIADSLTFVNQLSKSIELPDNVYAPGDGEVLFQWRRSGIFIEIGFFGDKTISWYARVSDTEVTYGDDPFDRAQNENLPEALKDALHVVD